MTKLRSYFLWFLLLCFGLTLVVGVVAAILPASVGGILTAVPYLGAMIFVLFRFLKKERRAPTVQEKEIYFRFYPHFWGYNLCGVLFGLFLFARKDPEILQNFMLYLKQPQFLSIMVIMLLMLAIPLYLITYWFYGKQAQRMASKMFNTP